MAHVIVTCLTTGRQVETGISVDPRDFYRAEIENSIFRCWDCGKPHIWSRENALLEAEDPGEAEWLTHRSTNAHTTRSV